MLMMLVHVVSYLVYVSWWDKLCKLGPGFGYFPNASKTWLVVKDRCHSEAMVTFAGTDVKLTSDRQPYLSSAIGSS